MVAVPSWHGHRNPMPLQRAPFDSRCRYGVFTCCGSQPPAVPQQCRIPTAFAQLPASGELLQPNIALTGCTITMQHPDHLLPLRAYRPFRFDNYPATPPGERLLAP